MAQPFTSYILPISGTDFVRCIACVSILAEYRKSKGLDLTDDQRICALDPLDERPGITKRKHDGCGPAHG